MAHASKINAIPKMTSFTTPSGSASASNYYSDYYPWKAFNQINEDHGWVTINGPSFPVLLNYTFQSERTICGYSLMTGTNGGSPGNAPRNWTFQGSKDGTTWVILDTQTNQTGWTVLQKRIYLFTNTESYKFYRFSISASNSSYVGINEVEMYDLVYDNKFLLSVDDQCLTYTAPIISDTTLIPKMTSNNAPSGIADASNTWGTNYPYKAFNGVGGAGGVWIAPVGSLPAWISYEFTNVTEITSYAIKSSTPSRQAKKWTFEGYIDGQWIILDKRDNVTDWVNGTKKVFTISESKSCKKYRLNIELVNGDPTYLEIDEIEMYGIIDYGRIKYLPSTSEDDFISRGLDKSTQINLEETLKYKEYVASESTVLGSGKVYARLVDPNKTPIKSIIIS